MKRASRKSFFELCAKVIDQAGRSQKVHCVLELEHVPATDGRLCWLQAVALAQETLRRMPTAEELRPVTSQAAARLLSGPRGPVLLLAA